MQEKLPETAEGEAASEQKELQKTLEELSAMLTEESRGEMTPEQKLQDLDERMKAIRKKAEIVSEENKQRKNLFAESESPELELLMQDLEELLAETSLPPELNRDGALDQLASKLKEAKQKTQQKRGSPLGKGFSIPEKILFSEPVTIEIFIEELPILHAALKQVLDNAGDRLRTRRFNQEVVPQQYRNAVADYFKYISEKETNIERINEE